MPRLCFRWFAAILVAAVSSVPTHAQRTYVSQRIVGTGFANLSITTDGTIGLLTASNITSWDIFLSNAGNTFTLTGPFDVGNSHVNGDAGALTATATDLLFNFSLGTRSYFLFQNNGGDQFYCLDTISGCGARKESLTASLSFTDRTSTFQEGTQIIASVSTVPEPTTMLSVFVGLASISLVIRRRARQT